MLNITIGASMVREKSGPDIAFRDPSVVAEAFKDTQNMAQEGFFVITLDVKMKMIDKHLITLGLVDSSLVHPREVFRAAILDNAVCIAIAHNHPSGDPSPSPEDIRITRQLIDAGKVLNISIIDHVIIGRPSYFSLRENGLVQFQS